ncbi:MAG: diguanylate cyclase [Azoarcus sp.]|jgi:diguanylate cyclase (GGDEF)-like protein|nr:diguanylate cyclase [Azoarcus sp.]
MRDLWKRFSRHIFTRILSREQIQRLIVPFGRSVYMRRYAASLIIARIQLISMFFAVVVPLWSIVDMVTFDSPVCWQLMELRFISAAVFVTLAWPRSLSSVRPYVQAIVMMVVMMLVPSVFYLVSVMVLDLSTTTQTQAVMARFYTYMPIVVLGGLAIFPLTALEIILLSLPVLITTMIGTFAYGTVVPFGEIVTMLWCMTMMTGIAVFSGMSQSHYMEGMVQRAMIDPLTGVATRRSGSETLKLLFHLSEISSRPLAVAFVDVDHFKHINDTYGHDIGDQILRQVAKRLHNLFRRSDTLVRWGGEEFLALLPNMPAHQLAVLICRLKAGGLGNRPDGTPLTASIGIVETQVDQVDDWHALVELADYRMYKAKEQGRARAVLPGNIVMHLDPTEYEQNDPEARWPPEKDNF